jgi:hypothetical protein
MKDKLKEHLRKEKRAFIEEYLQRIEKAFRDFRP